MDDSKFLSPAMNILKEWLPISRHGAINRLCEKLKIRPSHASRIINELIKMQSLFADNYNGRMLHSRQTLLIESYDQDELAKAKLCFENEQKELNICNTCNGTKQVFSLTGVIPCPDCGGI